VRLLPFFFLLRFLRFTTEEGMEYCSLEDAFPQIDSRSVKEKATVLDSKQPVLDSKAAKLAKAAKRRAKKLGMKDPFGTQEGPPPSEELIGIPITDPDRPGFAKFDILEKFQTVRGAEAIPTLPKAPSLFTERGNSYPGSTATPSYFGKGLEEEEGFSPFTTIPGDNPNYLLNPAALDSAFDANGAAKAGSSGFEEISPPVPNTIDVWKTVLPSGTFSAFLTSGPTHNSKPRNEASALGDDEPTKKLQNAGHLTPTYDGPSSVDTREKEELLKRIESLRQRIDQLESRRGEDTQTELLLFVCTGVFLQFGLQAVSILSA